MENSSRNSSEIFIFKVMSQTVLLENSCIRISWVPIHLFSNIGSWARPHDIWIISYHIIWYSFPVAHDPIFEKNWIKLIFFWWISFPVKRSSLRGDWMIFKISWAANLSRSGTLWSRSGMVPSCHINYQTFGEFTFGKIITKKLILTSNFSSALFRHKRSRQTFDTWFHNLGSSSIETT